MEKKSFLSRNTTRTTITTNDIFQVEQPLQVILEAIASEQLG